jgi:HK97 family phage major capsid protein
MVVYYQLSLGILFPLRDPEEVVCKRLKYGPRAVSRVEGNIYDKYSGQVFRSWYNEIRPRAIAKSSLAKNCYIIEFSNQDKLKYINTDILTRQDRSTTKHISVHKLQTNTKIKRVELININIKEYLCEELVEIMANLYDSSIYWGDGDDKPCGILNKELVIENSLIKCETCDDINSQEMLDLLPNLFKMVPTAYQSGLKWYMHPEIIDSIRKAPIYSDYGVYREIDNEKIFFGLPLEASNVMPSVMRHPYPIMVANLNKAYCLVDKVDEFSIVGMRDGINISYVVKCNIGGEVLRHDALVVLNTLEVAK